MIEMLVQRGGVTELVYVLKNPAEASEYIDFLSSFWPDAEFVIQPVRH